MLTRREQIEALLRENPWTPRQLAEHFGADINEIFEDLNHVKLSVRHPFAFRLVPHKCRDCGFVFKDRQKLKTPSKCPRCRGESIVEASFYIEEAEK